MPKDDNKKEYVPLAQRRGAFGQAIAGLALSRGVTPMSVYKDERTDAERAAEDKKHAERLDAERSRAAEAAKLPRFSHGE